MVQNSWLHPCFPPYLQEGYCAWMKIKIFRHSTLSAFSLSLCTKQSSPPARTLHILNVDMSGGFFSHGKYMICDSNKHRICLSLCTVKCHEGSSRFIMMVRLPQLVSSLLILASQSVKQMIYDVDHSTDYSLLHSHSFQLLGCSHPPVFFHLLQAISNYRTRI